MAQPLHIRGMMFRPSQSALQRYKVRRGAAQPPAQAGGRPGYSRGPRTAAWLFALAAVLAAAALVLWRGVAPPSHPAADLTYQLDLAEAAAGRLAITLVADGHLPDPLVLARAEAAFQGGSPGVLLSGLEAWALDGHGRRQHALAVERTDTGYRVRTGGARSVGVGYEVEIRPVSGNQGDVRRHISAPVRGGVRAAGYEIFLQPVDVAAGELTLAIDNPDQLTLLAPWPGRNAAPSLPAGTDVAVRPGRVAGAHVASGMGYRSEDIAMAPPAGGSGGAPAPLLPPSVLLHPRDLEDMTNALLACGDLHTTATVVRGAVIQLGADRTWPFPLDEARDLIGRIARTEIAFFGSAPSERITALLAANPVTTAGGFDAYGLHTGSSVLLMLHPLTTADQLREQAASIVAHEMFHGWLGEAIPQTDPRTLWFTEGMTTWFAARMLTAAGVWSPTHAREVLAGRLRRDYAGSPLLGRMAVADAAAEVMADPGQVRFAYAGSMAACMALDQFLSRRSGMMRPLDQVLRIMYARHRGEPLSREGIIAVIREVTGVDCTDWLARRVYGAEALPPVEELI